MLFLRVAKALHTCHALALFHITRVIADVRYGTGPHLCQISWVTVFLS